jgi:glucosamine 6-phosphate synthetase-like amidotransferase/phosphosugar isomerase protein
MGSSYDACYPAVTALARDSVATVMTDTAELLHFRLPMLHAGDDLILVSQSGERRDRSRGRTATGARRRRIVAGRTIRTARSPPSLT